MASRRVPRRERTRRGPGIWESGLRRNGLRLPYPCPGGTPRGKRAIALEAWRGPRERAKKTAGKKGNHAGEPGWVAPAGSGHAGKATIAEPGGSDRRRDACTVTRGRTRHYLAHPGLSTGARWRCGNIAPPVRVVWNPAMPHALAHVPCYFRASLYDACLSG